MSRRSLLNLVLLVLASLLMLVVVFEPGKTPPPQPPGLTPLRKDDIHTIHIDRHDAQSIVLEKVGKRWQMRQPVAAAVNPLRFYAIMKLAETRSLGSYSSAGRKLHSFGLDKPRVHVTFNDELSLAFGSNTPLDNRRYLLLGDQIHLITDSFYYHLIGGFTTFIDTALLPPQSRLEGLQLPGLTLKQVAGHWETEPQPEYYSADQAAALIEAWQHATALEVKKYSEGKGEEIVLHIAGQSEPIRFLITARTPELVLARPELGIQYHLAEHLAGELLELRPVTD
jgi:hypothetical protein